MHFSWVLFHKFYLGGSVSLPPWTEIRGLPGMDNLARAPAHPWDLGSHQGREVLPLPEIRVQGNVTLSACLWKGHCLRKQPGPGFGPSAGKQGLQCLSHKLAALLR